MRVLLYILAISPSSLFYIPLVSVLFFNSAVVYLLYKDFEEVFPTALVRPNDREPRAAAV